MSRCYFYFSIAYRIPIDRNNSVKNADEGFSRENWGTALPVSHQRRMLDSIACHPAGITADPTFKVEYELVLKTRACPADDK